MPKTAELAEGLPCRSALAQTSVDLARVACALERYRLAQGAYPNTLEALSPRFMEKVPHDILNGEPLRYRLETNGHYILYSVGWNQTDDQGKTVITNQDRQLCIDPFQGDWVWEYPKAK